MENLVETQVLPELTKIIDATSGFVNASRAFSEHTCILTDKMHSMHKQARRFLRDDSEDNGNSVQGIAK